MNVYFAIIFCCISGENYQISICAVADTTGGTITIQIWYTKCFSHMRGAVTLFCIVRLRALAAWAGFKNVDNINEIYVVLEWHGIL